MQSAEILFFSQIKYIIITREIAECGIVPNHLHIIRLVCRKPGNKCTKYSLIVTLTRSAHGVTRSIEIV